MKVMAQTEHERYCQSLGLKAQEGYMHKDLMTTKMMHWPETLLAFVEQRTKRIGFCGDVISQAVADWISGPRAEQQEAE